MSEADVIYAKIIDLNLSADNRIAKIEEETEKLKADGKLDVALDVITAALQGSALFPHQKQQLRDHRDVKLLSDPEQD